MESPPADEIIEAVYNMRLGQKEYFKTRDREVMVRCKIAEQRVDEMIAAYREDNRRSDER